MSTFCVIISVLTPMVIGTERLTNIDYVGLGYDAIFGNPHSDLRDPGFKQAVFELTYYNKSMSSDGIWIIPDHVQALQTLACSYKTESDTVTGASSYQSSLAVDAEVHGGYWNAKFSASGSYKTVKEGTNNYHNVYVETVAKCIQYLARIKRSIKLSDDLIDAVADLPLTNTTESRKEYLDFINYFGTHYVSEVVMGSKAVIRSEFEQTAWTRFEQTNINVKAAASASFNGITGGASGSSDEEKRMREQFDSIRSSKYEAYLGSRPSTDGKWETWAQMSGASPYPITYVLKPILELFIVRFMPKFSQDFITSRKTILDSVYKEYCGNIPDCGVPGPDRVPVRMDKVEDGIRGEQVTSCRPGFSLLSCGMGNLPNTEPEGFRRSYPISSTSCQCYDYFGATCVSWCTNAVQGFQIQSSERQTGTFSVTCPAQTKVLGCHIQTVGDKGESWRAHYPSDDGSSCTCYDYFGAYCKASCATNIYDYEVRKQYGTGEITVTCSENNYVLGCGINPGSRSGDSERWRVVKVSGINSCYCYDFFGATCYASCGKFS